MGEDQPEWRLLGCSLGACWRWVLRGFMRRIIFTDAGSSSTTYLAKASSAIRSSVGRLVASLLSLKHERRNGEQQQLRGQREALNDRVHDANGQ